MMQNMWEKRKEKKKKKSTFQLYTYPDIPHFLSRFRMSLNSRPRFFNGNMLSLSHGPNSLLTSNDIHVLLCHTVNCKWTIFLEMSVGEFQKIAERESYVFCFYALKTCEIVCFPFSEIANEFENTGSYEQLSKEEKAFLRHFAHLVKERKSITFYVFKPQRKRSDASFTIGFSLSA